MKIFSIVTFLLSCLFFSSFSYAESDTPQSINPQQTININTATAEEFVKTLSGIGLSKANKIIEYRNQFGPFISIEQLKEVSGIGQSTFDKNKDKITL